MPRELTRGCERTEVDFVAIPTAANDHNLDAGLDGYAVRVPGAARE
jgi:hypothetical protein